MIDTHSHIYLEEFDNDREAVVEHARKAGLLHLCFLMWICTHTTPW